MSDIQSLEQKIIELQNRIKDLEEKLSKTSLDDQLLMEELYKKSKNIVIRFQKASAIFLQKKLLIDFPRARVLIDRLEKEDVISPPDLNNQRKILTLEI